MTTSIRSAAVSVAVFGAWLALGSAPAAAQMPNTLPAARGWEAVGLEAHAVPWLHGAAQQQLALVACRPTCAAIPWQLDERDIDGRFVLEQGEEPNLDDPPGVLDENDLLLFMASDAGDQVAPDALPGGRVAAAEIEVSESGTARRGWVYLLRLAAAAPQSSIRYVRYDEAADRLVGARVGLGFAHGSPRVLALVGRDGTGENLLDRMKIRASASFLWGLFTVRRTEDDVLTLPAAWHGGAIRIIRRQRLWMRLGWRWRTPIFSTDTVFYRDFAEMPVSLHLNFTPRLLFADVTLRVALDFRALDGWHVETPGAPGLARVDGRMHGDELARSQEAGRWFALHGPEVTLVQALTLSPSLSGLRPQLYYRDDRDFDDPPETVPGAVPAIGYTFAGWDRIGSGDHWFAANAYALPPEQRVPAFIEMLREPLRVSARQLMAQDEHPSQVADRLEQPQR